MEGGALSAQMKSSVDNKLIRKYFSKTVVSFPILTNYLADNYSAV